MLSLLPIRNALLQSGELQGFENNAILMAVWIKSLAIHWKEKTQMDFQLKSHSGNGV
jgi:hypothetical protein